MKRKMRKGIKIALWSFAALFLIAGALSLLAMNFYLSPSLPPMELVMEYQAPYTDALPEVNLCGKVLFPDGFPLEVHTLGAVDEETVGTYHLFYSARCLFWKGEWKKTVTVVDTVPPEITLLYQEGYYVLPGGEYTEEGYRAFDNCDGDLTDKVTITREEDTLYYQVADSSGNTASAFRPIPFDDPVPPELSLHGEGKIF